MTARLNILDDYGMEDSLGENEARQQYVRLQTSSRSPVQVIHENFNINFGEI